MAKKSAPKHVEPEYESQDVPDEEPASVIEADEPVAAQPSMSKADACRAALAAGIDNTEEALEFTRKKLGVEIKPSDFFLYKGKQKQAAASASPKAVPAKRGRKPNTPDPAAPAVAHVPPATRSTTKSGEADLLESLETLKPLIASMGAEKVKRLVDLLG